MLLYCTSWTIAQSIPNHPSDNSAFVNWAKTHASPLQASDKAID